jgi:hypothetical protein
MAIKEKLIENIFSSIIFDGNVLRAGINAN